MPITLILNEDLSEIGAFDKKRNKYTRISIPQNTKLTCLDDKIKNSVLGDQYICEGTINFTEYSNIRINHDSAITIQPGGKRRNRTNRNRRGRKNRRSTQRR